MSGVRGVITLGTTGTHITEMSRFDIIRDRVRTERDKQDRSWGRGQTDQLARWMSDLTGGWSQQDMAAAVRIYNRKVEDENDDSNGS